jgi:anthranilate synthase component I
MQEIESERLQMAAPAEPQPSLTQVKNATASSDRISIIPIVKEITLTTESVTSAFRQIRAKAANQQLSFLLEIATPEDPIKTQYSIIGIDPYSALRTGPSEAHTGDPLSYVEPIVTSFDVPAEYRIAEPSILNGGAFGYISYDCVRYYEYKVAAYPQQDHLHLPESLFMFCGSFVCFDHVKRTIKIVALCILDADAQKRESNYAAATTRIAELEKALHDSSNASYLPSKLTSEPSKRATTTAGAGEVGYKTMVRKLRERIIDGDIIQCVPSHRVTRDASQFHALEIYETLRQLNPSRYMFYVECESFYIVGSSPELLVKVQNGLVETHPIAGTRPRGKTTEEDNALEKDLLADEKERAEHIMLVDLGRNDVNRVAKPETTTVNSLMHIERYSHVMRTLPPRFCDILYFYFFFPFFSEVPQVCPRAPWARRVQLLAEISRAMSLLPGAFSFSTFPAHGVACPNFRQLVLLVIFLVTRPHSDFFRYCLARHRSTSSWLLCVRCLPLNLPSRHPQWSAQGEGHGTHRPIRR